MSSFTFQYQVLPTEPFGLESGYRQIIPEGINPTIHHNPSTKELWITRPDGTSGTRRVGEEFYLSVGVSESTKVSARDNNFYVEIQSDDFDNAFMVANDAMENLLLALPAFLPIASRPFSHKIIAAHNSLGQSRAYNQWVEQNFFVYNTNKLATNFERAVQASKLASQNSVLTSALMFLRFGDFLVDALPPDIENAEILNLHPLQFLQYWKAIAVIAGDPSSDKDHQSRLTSFGFPSKFFSKRVEPLHTIRNRGGVAHVTKNVPFDHRHVELARETALEVINGYCLYLSKTM